MNKRNTKVVSRIVDELTNHYLDRDASKIEVTVENLEDRFVMSFKVYDIDYTDKEIEEISKLLNTPRDASIEAYYWTLMGESSNESKLNLLGIMIDKAEIYYTDSCLLLNICRLK